MEPPADSLDSSPRSRTTADASDGTVSDTLPPVPGGSKLRLMCSYGGHIVPRPHDKSLCYIGGETRIVVVERNSTLPELLHRLSKILLSGRPFTLKYQLPNEDLDSLITVSSEEDLENMIDEYDRLSASVKSARIRLFLFPAKLEMAASMGPILDRSGDSNKSDEWFLSAINGTDLLRRGFSDPASVDSLLGLNNADLDPNRNLNPNSALEERNSSFGSANSPVALLNLPPIRVHVGEARVLDQNHKQQQQEEGQPPSSSSCVPVVDFINHQIVSEDERSDHGVGYQRGQPPQPVINNNKLIITEDLPSPSASVSSDSSLSNAITRQKPPVYQEPSSRGVPSAFIDPPSKIPASYTPEPTSVQIQQLSDSPGYFIPAPQYDQLQQQQSVQPQQQFIHNSNPHYVPFSYYPVYPSQQPGHQIDPRYPPPPVYYVSAARQPENPQTGVYMAATGNTTTPHQILQQIPSSHQQQMMGYSQIQHPHPHPPSTTTTYGYDFADPAQTQVYFTQPLASQYQTMTSIPPTVVSSEASDSVKLQQIRTSQAL